VCAGQDVLSKLIDPGARLCVTITDTESSLKEKEEDKGA